MSANFKPSSIVHKVFHIIIRLYNAILIKRPALEP